MRIIQLCNIMKIVLANSPTETLRTYKNSTLVPQFKEMTNSSPSFRKVLPVFLRFSILIIQHFYAAVQPVVFLYKIHQPHLCQKSMIKSLYRSILTYPSYYALNLTLICIILKQTLSHKTSFSVLSTFKAGKPQHPPVKTEC